ncbi:MULTISPECIES: TauD/TfdA family dioxygenase [Cupriavidus]|uniref:TauD/TfdA family dioxygenase n=1 Tax=Cupriavidus oxalaticus TaxID=96344 RepID=A0A4P7L3S1_9BURK|nr:MULTISPECIES: TauD/TfdA family dioxygenase [Cupriavidus]MBF6987991.1 TauD/TfdA family dioxygenase [Cupriavidus sp. IK-TO18]QBY50086.1 TauD/TfdA family dioxygenase [Cupriavidus oxalaticus]
MDTTSTIADLRADHRAAAGVATAATSATSASNAGAGGLRIAPLSAQGALPLVVKPDGGTDWRGQFHAMAAIAAEQLPRVGGVLFRGFHFDDDTAFRAFASAFGHPLLSYEFGSTPRSQVREGVYTSTEYPAHQVIPLHNEQSYTLQWPMKIWFHCVQPSESGGETPIADSRLVYQRLDPAIRERFAQRRLMYVRNYGNGLDLSWQRAFNTEDRAQVERFCRAQRIEFEWKPDGELRTRQLCQAVARHPVTGEMVWFNQAHLFHVSNLAPHVRETLLDVVGSVDELPRNVVYGDGAPLEDDALASIRATLDQCTVRFPWQQGDVLMLDNMLAAHGRGTFTGARRVIVAMAEPAPPGLG